MVKYLLIMVLSFNVFSQTILKPNQSYIFKDTLIAFNIRQFNKLDSLLADTTRYQKQIGLLNQKGKISDSLEGVYSVQLKNCESRIQLYQAKEILYTNQDTLLNQKALVYKTLVDDLQKQVSNEIKKTGFFNDTFWFGVGAISGIVSVYLSSMVLHNIH